MASVYWVYVLQSEVPRRDKNGGELPGFHYVGMTTEPHRRLREHNGLKKGGAAFTRNHRPWKPVALYGPYFSRSDALKAEFALKKIKGAKRASWTPKQSSWCRGLGAEHPWVFDPDWEHSEGE